ncbi:MAG: hypothetical protein WBE72_08285 [Terracidiphilus sp.]
MELLRRALDPVDLAEGWVADGSSTQIAARVIGSSALNASSRNRNDRLLFAVGIGMLLETDKSASDSETERASNQKFLGIP